MDNAPERGCGNRKSRLAAGFSDGRRSGDLVAGFLLLSRVGLSLPARILLLLTRLLAAALLLLAGLLVGSLVLLTGILVRIRHREISIVEDLANETAA